MTNELTRQEQDRLSALELIIEKAWEAGGRALIEIRETRLYRKCGTFEEYCMSRWHKTGRAVRYLIEATHAVEELTDKIGNAVPVSQKAARAFSSVPQELRVEVAAHIANAHKPVTSVTVKEAHLVVQKKEKLLDEVGRVIPEPLVPRWLRRQEFRDMMKEVSGIKCRLEKFAKDGDEIWRKLGPTASERAAQLYSAISVAIPYAVCTVCDGWFEKLKDGACRACNSTGFMSKQQFELSEEDAKRIIKNDNLQRLSKSGPRLHP